MTIKQVKKEDLSFNNRIASKVKDEHHVAKPNPALAKVSLVAFSIILGLRLIGVK